MKKRKINIFFIIIIIWWLKWVNNNKEKDSLNALSIIPLTFTSSLTELNSKRKLQELFLKLEA